MQSISLGETLKTNLSQLISGIVKFQIAFHLIPMMEHEVTCGQNNFSTVQKVRLIPYLVHFRKHAVQL